MNSSAITAILFARTCWHLLFSMAKHVERSLDLIKASRLPDLIIGLSFFILFAFSLAFIYCITTTENGTEPDNQAQPVVTIPKLCLRSLDPNEVVSFFYFCE